jgi:hypothetical protein
MENALMGPEGAFSPSIWCARITLKYPVADWFRVTMADLGWTRQNAPAIFYREAATEDAVTGWFREINAEHSQI